MTSALRMHPSDARLWVMAGREAASDGDMDRARGIFMRGCRFCTKDEAVWLEYARCEMEWLARMAATGTSKALTGRAGAGQADDDGNCAMQLDEDDEDDDDDVGDGTIMPESTEGKSKSRVFGEKALASLKTSPAMDGAIPRAIFDVAKKQPFYSPSAAEEFFNVFSTFTQVPAQAGIIAHLVAAMADTHPNDPATGSCQVRQPLIGVEPSSPSFPPALREALARLRTASASTADKTVLAGKTIAWIEPLLAEDDIDPAIRTVLEHTKRKLVSP